MSPHDPALPWNQEQRGAEAVAAPLAPQPKSSAWVSAGAQWPLGRGWVEEALVAAGESAGWLTWGCTACPAELEELWKLLAGRESKDEGMEILY